MTLKLLPAKLIRDAPLKSYSQTQHGSSNKKYSHYIKPMLAKQREEPFDDPDWLFEIKWDGYRAIAEVGNENPLLYSRNGLSFENDYPTIYNELKKIKKKAVLDGEIVALDKDGVAHFQLLQQYKQDKNVPLYYYVFDCLSVDGQSIKDKPLLERKAILSKILPKNSIIRYSDHVKERGMDFFKAVKSRGLEGMMAKRADSTYKVNTRSADWLKIKNIFIEEAIIAGYTRPRGSRKHFGALILGIYKNKKLTYIGHTGTGFTDKILKDVYEKLKPLETDRSPFDVEVPVNAPVTWVKPQLVCNIKYAEITGGGSRRHPVFVGLRIDKEPKEVQEEMKTTQNDTLIKSSKSHNMGTSKTKQSRGGADTHFENIAVSDEELTIDGKELTFTHTDKIFWPDEGYTKGDVINYYNAVAPYIVKYLEDRPESLFRLPNGIKSPGFFHKDAGANAPGWVKTQKLFSESADKEVNYIICNDRSTLLYLANLGCIEINPWNSRLKTIDKPDYLVLDLDPSEKNTYQQVVETANVIKEILDKAGADAYPKTSGATGMHIYVPLGAQYTYVQARDFAHMIATMAQEQLPEITSLDRSLNKRGKDKIYIDYLQNSKGQTLATAYSLRPKPGATVSTPLEWKEVKTGLDPANFTFKNIMSRIKAKGDLFAGVLGKAINMKKCIKKLEG